MRSQESTTEPNPKENVNHLKAQSKSSRHIKVVLLFMMWLITFIPLYGNLIGTWLKNSNNSHGILVPFISAYFIWHKRDIIKKQLPGSSRWGLIILVISLITYVVSYSGAIGFLARLTIATSLLGLVLYNYGGPVLRTVIFPLLFLFFMIPVPDSIYGYFALPLQLSVSKISAALIQLASIPVYREGNMLYFAQAQLEVAEACSGLRSITSFVMLAVLFAYMLRSNWCKRCVLVLLAIPVAMLVNIIRVTGTGVLAHFKGGEVARGFMHEFSGMAVFAIGFLFLSSIYAYFNRKHKEIDVS
jgi:exosortase